MAKLSIIVVNYNAGDYLLACLRSIQRVSKEVDLVTYVVDNASTDDSIEKIKKKNFKIHLKLNEENLGFGRANNQILKEITSGFVLLLNPDTELEEGVLLKMIQFMEENEDVGAATCKILLANGKVDLTAHRGFPTPWASLLYFLGDDSLYHLSKKDMSQPHEVDAISGAFFLARTEVLKKVKYFDEDYFMYAEDIDLCYKIKQAGFKVMYIPSVKILHHKGVSSGLKKQTQEVSSANFETRRRSLNAFYSTMKIFYKKHYAEKYPFFVNWLIYLAINIKWWLAKRKLTV